MLEDNKVYDWTFVCELCGGTYVSQYAAKSVSAAIEIWKIQELPNILIIAKNDTPSAYNVDAPLSEHDDPALLNSLSEAYFWSFNLDFKRFGIFATFKTGLVTIVRTLK